jgi:NAD(P)-dependent dehydrogenase (short-subunit alcohol dehydrogenase family)
MAAKLDGKTALVSGGSLGIGLASARALARDGAAVVITGRRAEALNAAREQLLGEVPDAHIESFVADATRQADVEGALARTHGLAGRLDIIVSVVGDPTFKPLLMREADDVRGELEVNFLTAFMAVRYGVPLMTPGGSIVCVSSAAAIQTNWGLSIYGAAKAALERFVRAAALELAPAGIRINAVRPGATFGPERLADPALTAMTQAFVATTPMARIGEPDDVAQVVRFLSGPESGWVTGETLSADGGMAQNSGPNFMDAMFGKDVMDQVRAGRPAAK